MNVHPLVIADYALLEEFLYHAIFIPQGEELPSREIIFKPEIYIYIKDYGTRKGDHGVVAEKANKIIGAAWTRIIPAYGNIDESTPELAISMLPEHRGQGIGTSLMMALFVELKKHGYKRTSLSVQKNNPAVRFYERLGYQKSDESIDRVGHEDYIMVKNLM